MKRLLFFLAFMTVGTAALIELLVRQPTGPVQVARQPPQRSNVLNMGEVTINQMMGDHTQWELRATHALYDDNTGTADLKHVRFKIFGTTPGTEEEVVYTGRSDEAQLTRDPGDVILIGGVVLNKGDELEITSDRIEYNAKKQLVTSPGPTRVRGPQGVEVGDSLRYSVPDQKLDLTSPLFLQ